MYLGIDVGGTKVLLASFDSEGQIVKGYKFPTARNYETFLEDLASGLEQFKNYRFDACCCAIPGELDRKNGVGVRFGNLDWTNIPILNDLRKITGLSKVYLENDAKLAGLFEYQAEADYKNMLYIAIGTGMGIAVVKDGKNNLNVHDLGGAILMIDQAGQQRSWDSIASGHTLYKAYGMKASEINDPIIWQKYVVGLSKGISKLIETYSPDAVVIGGGVGTHFDKFGSLLIDRLKKLNNKMVNIPPIIKAKRPEEAVIYGCYDFIRQNLGEKDA